MRCEFPELTRCCFCFPLRLGLLVWAYIKIISSTLLFSLLMYFTVDECIRYCSHTKIFLLTFNIPTLTGLLVDIIFHLLFIISAHKKELKKMKIFYRYSIVALAMYVMGLIGTIIFMFTDKYFMFFFFFGFFQIAFFMWITVIQFYILILVRSEVVKLERNSNFEFVNHAAEADFPTKADLKSQEELGY